MDLRKFKEVSVLLWVDDDQVFLQSIRDLLKERGFAKVKTAPDAANAMRILETGLVQIMFCDLALPGVDGVQLIQSVRSYDLFSALPIVVVTGAVTKEAVVEAARQGVPDIVLKPVTGDTIDNKIVEILARQQKA